MDSAKEKEVKKLGLILILLNFVLVCLGQAQTTIEPGIDGYSTVESSYLDFSSPNLPPLPAAYFGPGSDPFEGQVALVGQPPEIPGQCADTLIARTADAYYPIVPDSATIPTEIVALNLVSSTPITVTTGGGAEIEPVAWWGFDAVENRTVLEPVGDIRDTVHGLYWLEQGASGKSISFDGRTTHIVRKSSDVPDLSGGLTVEAWVAPQVYSWCESAIVDWEKDSNAGFTFGVDCYGRVYFHAAVNGKW
jgi:hypothetical protein